MGPGSDKNLTNKKQQGRRVKEITNDNKKMMLLRLDLSYSYKKNTKPKKSKRKLQMISNIYNSMR